MATQHADSTIGFLNSVSNVLDTTLSLFPINDVRWIRQLITDGFADIITDLEKSLAEIAEEDLADQIDDIGDEIDPEKDEENSPFAQEMDKDMTDHEKEFQDIMGDDIMDDGNKGIPQQPESPSDESTQPTDQKDNLGLNNQEEENPMNAPDEEDSAQQPESPSDESTQPTEQEGQQQDYKPFSEDMPEMSKKDKKMLPQDINNSSKEQNQQLSPAQKQKKITRLQKLQQKILTKQGKKTKDELKPLQDKIKKIDDEIKEIEKKEKKNRNKLIKATIVMVFWVSIALIAIILGVIFIITIILSIPGAFVLEWGGTRLATTWAKYSAEVVLYVKKKIELFKDKREKNKEKKREQKEIRKVQATANRRSRPLLRNIDQQIQQLQQS